jgi:hypothetical protein
MGAGRALVSDNFDAVDILDTASGGVVQSIATTFPDGGTQQGVAWRPGEVWVSGWWSPLEIYNEQGTQLGTIDLAAARGDGEWPMHHLAFDGALLLVGSEGELTWFSITP